MGRGDKLLILGIILSTPNIIRLFNGTFVEKTPLTLGLALAGILAFILAGYYKMSPPK